MPEGYAALRGSAAWIDLSARGKTIATGRDRVRLLHNLTTNHIKQLEPGAGCYAFLLTPQGRIQGDLNIFCLEDRFLLDTEPETRERVPALIRKYIIADDVKLTDASDELAAIAVEGPAAEARLSAMGAPIPQAPWSHAAWDGGRIARVSFTGQPGFRVYLPSAQKDELVARLELPAATPDEARTVRIENGKPRFGEDIFDATLPQETGQMHAIHFNKGCYLGQEIVERIRARGHVNRMLAKVEIEGSEPPAAGSKLMVEGAEAGEITSAVLSPASGKIAALAYLRAQHARPGGSLSADGRPAAVA
jgi:folate-binding protein YgfZ